MEYNTPDNNIRISIIVPVYNTEKYLKRCLSSLINQTLKEIEIICIDDGSRDNSAKILNDFALSDNRVIVLSQKNSGQSAARNKGITHSSGKYIGFVDSDDWVDLDFFEKLYQAAEKYTADIAVASIIRLNKFHKKYHLKFDKEIVTNDVNKKFELCDVPELSYVWNKIYNRAGFIKNKFHFEEGMVYEDVILTPQILYYMNKLVTVPNTCYYYFRHSGSTVTLRNDKHNNSSIQALRRAMDFINENNIDIESHKPETYRFKIFGITVFKIRQKGKIKKHILFQFIKW